VNSGLITWSSVDYFATKKDPEIVSIWKDLWLSPVRRQHLEVELLDHNTDVYHQRVLLPQEKNWQFFPWFKDFAKVWLCSGSFFRGSSLKLDCSTVTHRGMTCTLPQFVQRGKMCQWDVSLQYSQIMLKWRKDQTLQKWGLSGDV
jgi:hypothetical protein